MTDGPTNEALFARAQRVIPGGVNSPVRAFRSVGGTPYFVDRAEGAYVWDVEGTRYIDLVQSYGAVILGHAHPPSSRRCRPRPSTARATARRPSARCSSPRRSASGCRACELVRLVSSGTEATMTAIRVARGFTGRRRREVRRRLPRPRRRPPRRVRQRRRHARPRRLGRCHRRRRSPTRSSCRTTSCPRSTSDVACVIVEPVAANMGLVPRRPASSKGCGPSATASAPCSSSTR